MADRALVFHRGIGSASLSGLLLPEKVGPPPLCEHTRAAGASRRRQGVKRFKRFKNFIFHPLPAQVDLLCEYTVLRAINAALALVPKAWGGTKASKAEKARACVFVGGAGVEGCWRGQVRWLPRSKEGGGC